MQKPAPEFICTAVIDGKFVNVKLSDYAGKYVVLFFYPMDFTFVCPTEILEFNDKLQKFRNIDTVVLGVSTDTEHSHLAWTKVDKKNGGLGEIELPLLADKTQQISKDYGVLIKDGEDAGIALRGLFIISDKGIVRHMSVNDLPVGRNVEEVLRLVKAYKHTDENGVVCPMNWNPGNDTIVPNPDDSKEFFSKNN